MNYHGPLGMNSGGKCGGAITAMKLLQLVAANARQGDAIIFVGDFNANPNTPELNLLAQHLRHSFSNGMDNVFTNIGPAAMKAKAVLGNGGSDHNALAIVLELAGPPPLGPPTVQPPAVPPPRKPAGPPPRGPPTVQPPAVPPPRKPAGQTPLGPPMLQPPAVPPPRKPAGLQPSVEPPKLQTVGATQPPVAKPIFPALPTGRPAGLPAMQPSAQRVLPLVPQNPLIYMQQRP